MEYNECDECDECEDGKNQIGETECFHCGNKKGIVKEDREEEFENLKEEQEAIENEINLFLDREFVLKEKEKILKLIWGLVENQLNQERLCNN